MFKHAILCAVTLMMFSTPVSATENLYGVLSAGYTETEFDLNQVNQGSYKFAVGYQFDRQWYAEFGYQQLADEGLKSTLPVTLAEVDSFQPGMEGDALFAAMLGKAAGSMGELFYRVGILKTDIRGQSLAEGDSCELGQGQPFNISGSAYTLCEYDEGGVAGVIGVGFDFYVGTQMMIRTEFEHIAGENGLSINAAYVGFRFNFR